MGAPYVSASWLTPARALPQEVGRVELDRTKGYSRWLRRERLLATPWEERVRDLPRYSPPPGYDPTGEGRGDERVAAPEAPP